MNDHRILVLLALIMAILVIMYSDRNGIEKFQGQGDVNRNKNRTTPSVSVTGGVVTKSPGDGKPSKIGTSAPSGASTFDMSTLPISHYVLPGRIIMQTYQEDQDVVPVSKKTEEVGDALVEKILSKLRFADENGYTAMVLELERGVTEDKIKVLYSKTPSYSDVDAVYTYLNNPWKSATHQIRKLAEGVISRLATKSRDEVARMMGQQVIRLGGEIYGEADAGSGIPYVDAQGIYAENDVASKLPDHNFAVYKVDGGTAAFYTKDTGRYKQDAEKTYLTFLKKK